MNPKDPSTTKSGRPGRRTANGARQRPGLTDGAFGAPHRAGVGLVEEVVVKNLRCGRGKAAGVGENGGR